MIGKVAIFIPCFNEAKSLPGLLSEIKIADKKLPDVVDWYIFDNGSTDNTPEILSNFLPDKSHPNIMTLRIEKNLGYGYGLKFCLSTTIKNCIYRAYGWTHADGQTPVSDVTRACQILLGHSTKEEIIIKGKRIARDDGWIAKAFTHFQTLLISCISSYNYIEPNAQPTICQSNLLLDNIKSFKDDGLFDISVMLAADKSTKFLRFPVKFFARSSGIGANQALLSKIKFSLKNIKFILSHRFAVGSYKFL